MADAIDLLRAHDYDRRASVLDGIEIAFRDAGHILGSSIVELWADGRKLVFSGDLGPHGTPILRDPTPIREADLLLMESTYGDRNHKQRADTIIELGDILEQAWRDGGNVLKLKENVENAMARILADLPVGIETTLVANQPAVVHDSVNEFTEALFEAVACPFCATLPATLLFFSADFQGGYFLQLLFLPFSEATSGWSSFGVRRKFCN